MNLKTLLLPLALLLSITAQAQSISPAQIERFKSLPKAQQEALAKQYGVDLDSIAGSSQLGQRPQQVDVVEGQSSNQNSEEQLEKASKSRKKNRRRLRKIMA